MEHFEDAISFADPREEESKATDGSTTDATPPHGAPYVMSTPTAAAHPAPAVDTDDEEEKDERTGGEDDGPEPTADGIK
jgi:hypothetical protein